MDAYEKSKGHGFVDGICMVCGEKDPDYVEPTPVVTPKPTVEPTPTPTPTPEPTPEQPKNPFEDVKESDWYYNSVMWAVAANVTGGTSPTTFSPENPCTRGQVVTFLWAANGRPEPPVTGNPFTDVSESDWYYKAVLWAVENGITKGTSATTFSPEQDCTRAQIVTFLYAAENRPFVYSYDNSFTDVKESDWFYEPVMWAAENGVTGGIGGGKFGPNNVCTRGQIVTFLFKVNGDK